MDMMVTGLNLHVHACFYSYTLWYSDEALHNAFVYFAAALPYETVRNQSKRRSAVKNHGAIIIVSITELIFTREESKLDELKDFMTFHQYSDDPTMRLVAAVAKVAGMFPL